MLPGFWQSHKDNFFALFRIVCGIFSEYQEPSEVLPKGYECEVNR
jgi:hypothetical protein